jgi:hypothetical protein
MPNWPEVLQAERAFQRSWCSENPSRGGRMAKNIEALARKLGATVAGTVSEYSAGAFGIATLAETLRQRLEPSVGKRPGRPATRLGAKGRRC